MQIFQTSRFLENLKYCYQRSSYFLFLKNRKKNDKNYNF